MKKLVFSAVLLLAIVVAAPAHAAVFMADESVNTSENLASDLFSVGDQVNVSHDVVGDIFAAGNQVNVSGNVIGDIIAAGEQVLIQSKIGDDIMVAGGSVVIEDSLAQDVFAAGDSVVISGNYTGDLWLAGRHIEVRPGTTIAGNLRTASGTQPIVADSVRIEGEHIHKLFEEKKTNSSAKIVLALRSLVGLFVLSLIIYYVAPGLSKKVGGKIMSSTWKSLAIGGAWIVLLLPAFILLMISTIGFSIGFLLLLLTPVLFIISWGISAIFLGKMVMEKGFKKAGQPAWQQLAVGSIALTLVGLVPVIGGLAIFVLIVATLGATLMTLHELLQGPAQ